MLHKRKNISGRALSAKPRFLGRRQNSDSSVSIKQHALAELAAAEADFKRAQEEEEKAWFDSEMQRVRDNVRSLNAGEPWPYEEYDTPPPATMSNEFQDQQGSSRTPYPNIA